MIERAEILGTNIKSFKEAVKGIPGVINIVSSSSVPGRTIITMDILWKGRKDETLLMWTNFVDYDFLDTYGMTLLSGRTFNKLFPS